MIYCNLHHKIEPLKKNMFLTEIVAMIDRIFVDSNVWVYLFTKDDNSKYAIVEKFILKNGYQNSLVISYQVINEVSRILVRKNFSEADVRNVIEMLTEICIVQNNSRDIVIMASKFRQRGDFSSKLKNCNVQFVELWNRIEKNVSGLLENPLAYSDENKDNLVDFLGTLKGMQDSIVTSSESIESLKAASLKNIGIQGTLNQSIRNLDDDLKVYLDSASVMHTSIDKLLAKSRFIVGDIDFTMSRE